MKKPLIKVGGQTLFVVPQEGFRDEELFQSRDLLAKHGITTHVVCNKSGEAHGVLGASVPIDVVLGQVKIPDYRAVIFIGGPGAVEYFSDEKAIELARQFRNPGRMVGAFSTAASILANAGLLISRKVTGFPTQERHLVSRGAEYTGMPVEVDSPIITARGPDAIREFVNRFLWELSSRHR
ncbi:thiamine biosynthesis protein ThiJ [bacterium]|nr:thiamine biosynthesis protein ThiJ [bacterium]|tara:strand:+ start:67 stop:609 length:543 start_codon:yes stop_codon:yes gene_type:complete